MTLFDAAHYLNKIIYNVKTPPAFYQLAQGSKQPTLDDIVEGILLLLTNEGYPTENVSVSLVDLTGNCCDYAQYQDTERRYPASIVKLFWIVALYGHYQAGMLEADNAVNSADEALMVHYSNNGASSRILDAITGTESGDDLEADPLKVWIASRQQVNEYFLGANYSDLNIAHKTFPIPDLALDERAGRDSQFAVGTESAADDLTARNYLTTLSTARLLYEIHTGQAISQEYSDRIKAHLQHSTDPEVWQSEDSNAIEDFFGEYLPPTVQLQTKLGYTFDDGRQEAAIIASEDGQTQFILVVFANDSRYSQEGSKAFPEIARYVYEQMTLRSQSSRTGSTTAMEEE
ncbi:MAG: serine hydrolase [Leptolyngbya sp. SIO1E4]|nr:serine hydrolase [Leptolyngbya sp. SIO1E4]